MDYKINDRVKRSEYTLRSHRDYWNRWGRYDEKAAAKRRLDKEMAKRGTVTKVEGKVVHVKWDDNTVSYGFDYLLAPAKD